ncbi:MAG TPA: hypothetical protein VF230_11385 [Acidimicrobiales bacterium]
MSLPSATEAADEARRRREERRRARAERVTGSAEERTTPEERATPPERPRARVPEGAKPVTAAELVSRSAASPAASTALDVARRDPDADADFDVVVPRDEGRVVTIRGAARAAARTDEAASRDGDVVVPGGRRPLRPAQPAAQPKRRRFGRSR